MHDGPGDEEQYRQHDDRVGIGRAAEQVELEGAEQGHHGHAGQAIRAARQPAELVGDLVQDQRDAQRHHQAGQVGAAHHQHAGHQPEQRAQGRRDDQPQDGIDAEILGQQRRAIGAQSEEGRMAQRDDAGVSEDQVERNGEQGQDGQFVQQQEPPGQHEGGTDGHHPEDDFEPPDAGPARAIGAQRVGSDRGFHYLPPARANRPCGRHISMMIMTQ